jgi:hypothetical protein
MMMMLGACVRGYIPSKSCFEDPSQVNCSNADIYYPTEDVQSDVATICALLPATAGCSVRRMCDAGLASGAFCQPFSLLADLCGGAPGGEAQGHARCAGYQKLCNSTKTAVKQCTSRPAVPGLVPSFIAQDAVSGLCTMMPDMQTCSECSSSDAPGAFRSCPDPLRAYASICLSMQMDGCEAWRSMCDTEPEGLGKLCGASEEATCSGVMQMYFHTGMCLYLSLFLHIYISTSIYIYLSILIYIGLNDFVLFKSWVPCTPERYTAACLFTMILAVAVNFLKAVRVRLEYRFLRVSAARERERAVDSGVTGGARETGRLGAGGLDSEVGVALVDAGGNEVAGGGGRARVRARRYDSGSEAPLLASVCVCACACQCMCLCVSVCVVCVCARALSLCVCVCACACACACTCACARACACACACACMCVRACACMCVCVMCVCVCVHPGH